MFISDFNLINQKRPNVCGYTTTAMIMSYLEGQQIDEDYLVENEPLDAYGITFKKVMEVYKKYLKKYSAEIVYGDIKKMSEIIKSSLKLNLPLHIQYLTNNLLGDGKPILHYSALIGYDDATKSYSIADPYGSIRTLKESEFFDAISFRNECLPDIIKQKYPSNMMIRFVG